jgi:DNA-binding response OmpR family regulator
MNAKRVLLLAEDRLLNHLYRARFEAAGFHVDAARSGSAALKLAADHRPDAIVLDPLTISPEVPEVITRLRAEVATERVPIIALPTNRPQFSEAAQNAGATCTLSRAANPFASAIDAVQASLGMDLTASLQKNVPFQADDSWLKQGLQSAPDAINLMRQTLHNAARDPRDVQALREFLQRIHNFTEQMHLLGERHVFHFGSALEALAHDLVKLPAQSNPSTLRTLGQAVDFLNTLIAEKNRGRTREPGTAQVLVVDDEPGARRIIMAGAQTVGLKPIASDTPTNALAALSAETFDLIFLDVGMPEMNGFDLCTKIRALPLHERTPIVFITGMATFQNRVQSNLAGGNDFIGKPFNVAELAVKALIWVFKGHLGAV